MKNKIQQFENYLKSLEKEKNSLQGQVDLLISQIGQIEDSLTIKKQNKALFEKCTNFLNYIQTNSNELVKQSFESIVTQALQFIMGDGWGFQLEFAKRGNLGELFFCNTTPEKKTSSRIGVRIPESGGVLDVISLALRLVILKLAYPNKRGLLYLDEPFKGLRGKEYLENANKFLKFIHEKFGYMILVNSHESELKTNPEFNLIEIGKT